MTFRAKKVIGRGLGPSCSNRDLQVATNPGSVKTFISAFLPNKSVFTRFLAFNFELDFWFSLSININFKELLNMKGKTHACGIISVNYTSK